MTSEWPQGTDGFTIQLSTVPKDGATAENVDAAKQTAVTEGAIDAAVLDSDLYASLPPGNYVIYSGVYTDRRSAEVALKGLRKSFPSARGGRGLQRRSAAGRATRPRRISARVVPAAAARARSRRRRAHRRPRMSPSPIERLKPYFKPRPRTPPAGANAPAPSRDATPAARRRNRAPPRNPRPSSPPPRNLRRSSRRPPAHRRPSRGGRELERRREQLARRYGELESDLGGLVYEMAIRDHFRLDVVVRRAAELQAVDAELTAVEQALGIGDPERDRRLPVLRRAARAGAQFCGRCGAAVAPPTGAPRRPRRPPPRSAGGGARMRLPGRLVRGPLRPDRASLARFASLRWAALPMIDRRWTAPMSAVALGFGLFVGVAIGPGTRGQPRDPEARGDPGSRAGAGRRPLAPDAARGGGGTKPAGSRAAAATAAARRRSDSPSGARRRSTRSRPAPVTTPPRARPDDDHRRR